MDVCFLTTGGDHPVDIIAVASCDILTFPVGAVVELAAGIVEASLVDAMVVLAAEMVEVPLVGTGVLDLVQDKASLFNWYMLLRVPVEE